jgi:hypothetical protein
MFLLGYLRISVQEGGPTVGGMAQPGWDCILSFGRYRPLRRGTLTIVLPEDGQAKSPSCSRLDWIR